LPLEDAFESSDSSEPSDTSEAFEKRILVDKEEVTVQHDTKSMSEYEGALDKDKTDIVDKVSKTAPEKPELTPAIVSEASEASQTMEAMELPENPSEAEKGVIKDLEESAYNSNHISCSSKHNSDCNNDNFFAHSYVAFDLEWKDDLADNTNSKVNDKTIYAAAFVDNHGNKKILHISEFGGSEPALLKAITEEILKYPTSIGWYSTGVSRGSCNIAAAGGVSAAA
jgi:hypothetical protein